MPLVGVVARGEVGRRPARPELPAPYGARPNRDTRNAADMIYGGHTELLVNLSGDAATGFTGAVARGVKVGTISAG